jgi:YD repeat-containing protein
MRSARPPNTGSTRRGQLVQVTQPDGATHHYTWDGEGNLVRYVDPLGQATTWKYNGAGAPLLRVDALGHTLRTSTTVRAG